MKKRHVPIRTCIGCRQKNPAHMMMRLKAVRGTVILAARKDKHPGRGCYICRREECVRAALRERRLARALRQNIADPSLVEGLLRGSEKKG